MTLLRALRSSPEDPTFPLSSKNLADWLSGPKSDAGVSVSEQRVLGLPAYYRGLALTAGTVGVLPLHRYKKGTRKKSDRGSVLDKPNPRQTEVEWRITQLLHGIAWGNAYSRKVRNGAGEVKELWPLHPSCITQRIEDPSPANPSGKVFLLRSKSGTESKLTPSEVLHLPYMSMDGLAGIRPLEVFRQSLGLAIAGDDSAAKFYGNGSRLSGILTVKEQLDSEGTAASRLKQRWKEATGGVDKTGDIAVLDNGATFTPVSIPPADAQLLQSRQWSVSEVSRMTGTPPHLIGDMEKSSSWGTGQEQLVLAWVKFTLQVWITSWEQRLNTEVLLPGEYVKHNLNALLRGDSAARAAFYHQAIIDGWLTRNEVRELEDMDPLDGLDDPIVPSNMTLISVDGSIVPLSSAGTAAAAPA